MANNKTCRVCGSAEAVGTYETCSNQCQEELEKIIDVIEPSDEDNYYPDYQL